MIAFTLRLDEDTDKQLELIAFVQGKSKTAIIRESLDRYLALQADIKDPRDE